jgi:PleD family two-component response regulator
LAKPRILIADDEPHIREVLHMHLELNGFEVFEATDGLEALEMAERLRPDVMLLDVMMPRLDGYETLRRLRASYATRFIPVIMLTAKTAREDAISGFREGANDYIVKPFNNPELTLRIENQLRWSRQQREANPLTGLPGNLSINEETSRRLASGAPFALLQVDIDYFKAYNDHYGYARGDDAIQALARILVEAAGRHGEGNFVGHIGGDDFILIVSSEICTSCSDFRPILLEYITTMGVVVYKIESDSAFPPGNSTLAYAYTPTVALFSAGELLVSVDPHERASAFSSYEGFVDWISRYVAYTATTTSLT